MGTVICIYRTSSSLRLGVDLARFLLLIYSIFERGSFETRRTGEKDGWLQGSPLQPFTALYLTSRQGPYAVPVIAYSSPKRTHFLWQWNGLRDSLAAGVYGAAGDLVSDWRNAGFSPVSILIGWLKLSGVWLNGPLRDMRQLSHRNWRSSTTGVPRRASVCSILSALTKGVCLIS